MEAATLSVSITGDASGLISAMESAEASIATVQSSAGKLMNDFDGKEAQMKITALDNTAEGVESARANINSLQDKTVTISVRYNASQFTALAAGTKNAREGLAVVNDERGKSDPRELIEHNGSFYMFGGRDVVVPLSRGDRVYTADQTKKILSSLPHYASGKNVNYEYEWEKSKLTHYKKTHNMSPSEELEAWNELLKRFSYDWEAAWEIEEQIFSAEQKIAKEQEKLFKEQEKALEESVKAKKKANEAALADYKKSSDAWIKYEVQVAGMGVDEQIEAYERQLYNYNAMVSEMAESTLYTAEEMKEIWNDFYEYKSGVDLKIGLLENEKNRSIYEKWQSDAANWKNIRDTYGDWAESGDSPVKFYERSIERISEMFNEGHISWQSYSDDTMEAILNLYKAKMEQTDALLESQKQYISDLKQQFLDEENALQEKWTVSDRNISKSEISEQLAAYKNAVTERGIDKYKSLQEQMKKIKREEEMYKLQQSHSRTLSQLEESYNTVEANKKYLLAVIEKSGLNIEEIVSGARYDIENMQSTLTYLFDQTIKAIKSVKVSSSSYSDNRNINITNSNPNFSSLTNRIVGSIAHGNYY